MTTLTCAGCGSTIEDHELPKTCACGAAAWKVSFELNVGIATAADIRAKEGTSTVVHVKHGASRSRDGSFAQIDQVVDKKTRRYKKKVTLADGTVVKDVEGPLEDQGLHGPQKP